MIHKSLLIHTILTITMLTIKSSNGKPIMVQFGTNQGPIVPQQRTSTPSSLQPRTLVVRSPAPVREEREDIPNPEVYRAPIPHQYRTKLLSIKVPNSLYFGTPLDQRFTPSLQKYSFQKKQAQTRSLGLEYTGPNLFDKRDYDYSERRQKTTLQPSVRYVKPHYYQQIQNQYQLDYNQKYVPQIGIIYAGGARYYVPQLIDYQQQQRDIQDQKDANSVYDHPDEKYNL